MTITHTADALMTDETAEDLTELAKTMLTTFSTMGEDGNVAGALSAMGIRDKDLRVRVWRRASEMLDAGWKPQPVVAPVRGETNAYLEIGGRMSDAVANALVEMLSALGEVYDAVLGMTLDTPNLAAKALFTACAERRPLTLLTDDVGNAKLTTWLKGHDLLAVVSWTGRDKPADLPEVMPLRRAR